jgi:hypothetical protein
MVLYYFFVYFQPTEFDTFLGATFFFYPFMVKYLARALVDFNFLFAAFNAKKRKEE